MIKFTLTAKQVKDYFGMIKIFGGECRLHIEPDKLRVALVDHANIGLVRSEVEVDTGAKKPLAFGLMIHRLLAFTKVSKDTDPIEFTIEEKKDGLCMKLECMDHVAKIRSIDANLIRKDPNMPTLDLPYTFPASGERINEFFKMGGKEKFRVVLKDKKVVFKTLHECDYEYQTTICNAPAGNAMSMFSSDYLKPVFARMKKSMITFGMNNDHPLKLVTIENGITVEVLMAPRIKAD